jgi:hypothetical protein
MGHVVVIQEDDRFASRHGHFGHGKHAAFLMDDVVCRGCRR